MNKIQQSLQDSTFYCGGGNLRHQKRGQDRILSARREKHTQEEDRRILGAGMACLEARQGNQEGGIQVVDLACLEHRMAWEGAAVMAVPLRLMWMYISRK